MMNQQKTRKAALLKYSLIVPLALALVVSSNAQTVVNKVKKAITTTTKTNTKTAIQPASKNQVYDVVEKMPQYPGGEIALLNYISHNLKYPVSASQMGIHGRVIVRFVVSSIGKVEKAEIVRSLNYACDKEALRVVSSLANWIPGEQNGKKVSVYYTLPITFRLE